MKTVGDKIEKFAVTGVKPGQPEDAFFDITDESFAGKWKDRLIIPERWASDKIHPSWAGYKQIANQIK